MLHGTEEKKNCVFPHRVELTKRWALRGMESLQKTRYNLNEVTYVGVPGSVISVKTDFDVS